VTNTLAYKGRELIIKAFVGKLGAHTREALLITLPANIRLV